jgi:hypothetical protein
MFWLLSLNIPRLIIYDTYNEHFPSTDTPNKRANLRSPKRIKYNKIYFLYMKTVTEIRQNIAQSIRGFHSSELDLAGVAFVIMARRCKLV